ncbi:MAG: ATP-binding cassette domain-containing protein [Actinobacteria bacterium]|nr:ATP-binding cassette domain-containing protein [Actinomycetota bacterium]
MLDVVDLTVRRGDRVVFRRARLHVERGERVAVHGPSGCGKTTLLHAIAGLVTVDEGQIVLDGVEVTTTATHRRGIGLVFQDDRLFPHFDVADNVTYSLRVQGMARHERRRHANDWLEQVGLGGFAQRSVDSLSGGEAKRVALARALAASPRVVLLDEPLTGLDDSPRWCS